MKASDLAPGLKVRTFFGELDADELGRERYTPAGAVGELMFPIDAGCWSVAFGAATVNIAVDELLDRRQYHVNPDLCLEAVVVIEGRQMEWINRCGTGGALQRCFVEMSGGSELIAGGPLDAPCLHDGHPRRLMELLLGIDAC